MLHYIVHSLCFIALFLRFIAFIMPCDIVHVTQYCTLLMFHCIGFFFTLYSVYYALGLCSCFTTLYVRLMVFVAMVMCLSAFFRAYYFLVYHLFCLSFLQFPSPMSRAGSKA